MMMTMASNAMQSNADSVCHADYDADEDADSATTPSNDRISFADDGMEREESGHPGAVEGGYSYTSPEGELVNIIIIILIINIIIIILILIIIINITTMIR